MGQQQTPRVTNSARLPIRVNSQRILTVLTAGAAITFTAFLATALIMDHRSAQFLKMGQPDPLFQQVRSRFPASDHPTTQTTQPSPPETLPPPRTTP